MDTPHPPQVLRLRQVEAAVGLSKAAIYRGVKNGTFPVPIKVGERAVGWLASEVAEWIAARPRAHI